MRTMRYAIGVGSNLGDREAHHARGACLVGAWATVVTRSALLENPAVGGPPGQGDYLNAAWVIETSLAPEVCLERLLAVEAACGRSREVPGGARTLDLDLLLADPPLTLDGPHLVLPHPRLHVRRFVMLPLLEVAADWEHPRLGCRIRNIDRAGWA